jgi:type I restriction enzyme S subunit
MKWPVKKLGNFIEIVMGQAPHSDQCNKEGEGVVFVKAGEFGNESPVVREWTTDPLKMAKADDTLICVVGATAGKINRSRFECAIGRSVAAVRTCSNQVEQNYLHAFLSTKVIELRNRSQGAAQAVITREMLQDIEIPLPPLAEQQRIAALLDTADRILKLRELAIAKLDQLAQSVFVEMFGDPLANSKNFETVKVSGICKLVNGRAFKPTEWKESGKPIIRIQNLNDETKPFNYTQENFDEKYLIRNGDVLFSWSGTPGTSFGCFKWLRKDGWLNQHIFKVILNEKLITADFFIMQMNLKIGELISQAHGGVGLQHVTKKMVDELPLLLPSMKLQLDFCKRVTEFEKIKRIYKNAFDSTNLLQSSLQHQSFAVN